MRKKPVINLMILNRGDAVIDPGIVAETIKRSAAAFVGENLL